MRKLFFLIFLIIISYSCSDSKTKELDSVLKEVIKESGAMIALNSSSNGNNSSLTLTVQSAVRNEFAYGKILISMFEKLRAKNIVFEEYIINDGQAVKITRSVEMMNLASIKMKLFTSHHKLLSEKKFSAFYNLLSPELKLAFNNTETMAKFEAMDYGKIKYFEGFVFFNEKNTDFVMFANSHEPNDIRLSYDLSLNNNKIIGIQMH
jgi:hypothetical protein